MRIEKKLFGLAAAAFALVPVMGCCETDVTGSTYCQPTPTLTAGGPALLEGSVRCPPPFFPETRPSRGEVQGELVYNLGQGVISNSNAAVLAGGRQKPTAIRLSGGVKGRCNPIPAKYLQSPDVPAPVGAPAVTPVAVPPSPVAAAPLPLPPIDEPFEPGVAAGGYCAPVVCPVLPGSAEVCLPGSNISECFTLSESEVGSGPAPLVPVADKPLDSAPEAPAAPSASAEPAAPAEPDIPAAPVDAVADTMETASIGKSGKADKYVSSSTVEALAPPPELVTPEAAPEAGDSASTSFPAETASSSAALESMPPVPQVTDMDEAVDAMDAVIAKDRSETSSLPEVELPPKLN